MREYRRKDEGISLALPVVCCAKSFGNSATESVQTSPWNPDTDTLTLKTGATLHARKCMQGKCNENANLIWINLINHSSTKTTGHEVI